jgi:hypothetical protein
MQIAGYDASDSAEVNRLKYDIDYNISRGADILNDKWSLAPVIGDGDRNKLENWYFALWAYNRWTVDNNPNNAASLGQTAYQDKVLKIAATEYFKGLVTPVRITPVSPELIPIDTLPSKDQTWDTPEPYTLGDLQIGAGSQPSRGNTAGTLTRIKGTDRTDTVNRIALTGWPSGSETVILTRSDAFPDALAGVPLARKYKAPILSTHPDRLDKGVIEVLNALKPQKVIILGGEKAVGLSAENKLREVLSWTKRYSKNCRRRPLPDGSLDRQTIFRLQRSGPGCRLGFSRRLKFSFRRGGKGDTAFADVTPETASDHHRCP